MTPQPPERPALDARKREALALGRSIYATTLSKRQREVLTYMRDTRGVDGEVVVEGPRAYFGTTPTNVALVYSLVRLMAIEQDGQYSDFQRYTLTGIGEDLLDGRPMREAEWC